MTLPNYDAWLEAPYTAPPAGSRRRHEADYEEAFDRREDKLDRERTFPQDYEPEEVD